MAGGYQGEGSFDDRRHHFTGDYEHQDSTDELLRTTGEPTVVITKDSARGNNTGAKLTTELRSSVANRARSMRPSPGSGQGARGAESGCQGVGHPQGVAGGIR
jgi:hypothetical protein